MGQMQRDASEYQQVQANAALQQQANTYKEQLETQGYLPEQAQQVTDQVMRMQVENNNLSSSANAYGKHIQEKQFVVEHFVKKYNLGIDDMVSLRTYNNPKSMEDAAKKLSSDRERDSELSRFRQAQVPTQSFDNSQGNPQVAADEGSWLDRYNAGDRSPSAAAAAKRAAGIG
jgi:organic radical activating enzyme